MRQEDLQTVVPGFDDPVSGSQAVFRCVLRALSMPGRLVDVPAVAQKPAQGHGAAAVALLALLDSDCTLWLSPSLRNSEARAWLRFHTGCRCVDDPEQARFLWVAQGDAFPGLASMHAGSDESPELAATCVMEVAQILAGDNGAWGLEGPGVDGCRQLTVQGLPADFAEQWRVNHGMFPRGVDVLLATDAQLAGLPRSTRLHSNDTVEA